MRFADMRRMRCGVLDSEYSADSPAVCAMGVVRAVGKFLKHLARSTRAEPLGTDHRPAVVEALGDMLMYCCGTANDACELAADDEYDCIECVATVLRFTASILEGEGSPRNLLSSVCTLCRVCAVDPEEAFVVSLRKSCSK